MTYALQCLAPVAMNQSAAAFPVFITSPHVWHTVETFSDLGLAMDEEQHLYRRWSVKTRIIEVQK